MIPNTNGRLKVKPEETGKLEFRSEEVQDILSGLPHWFIRSGSGYLLGILVLALIATWLIKYPDTIKAPVVLTTQVPPANIIAGSSGYLTLWTKDSEIVKEGDYLGYISNASDVEAVLDFKKELDSFKIKYYRTPVFLKDYIFRKGLSVGELQDAYNVFIRSIEDYQFADRQKNYRRQINSLQNQAGSYYHLNRQLEDQNALLFKDLQLAEKKYARDSILYQQNVIARAELETGKRAYLKDQQSYKNALSAVTNNTIRASELEKRIEDLQMEEIKQEKDYLVAIEAAMNQLRERLKSWEQAYMLKAPFKGSVAFFKFWADHQYIKSGEEILAVIPDNENYFVQARVPVTGSGKIAKGQKVHIRLDNYPYQEYGMVNGRIRNISLLPRENTYIISIDLTQGLLTSYGRKILFKQEMSGQAEIITEDMRLLERFFYRIRKIFN